MAMFPFAFAALAYLTTLAVMHLMAYTPAEANMAANYYSAYIIPGSMLIAGAWIMFAYHSGDHMLLSAANAVQIHKIDQPEIYRMVENICITMGLPYPKVYLIDDDSLNAFATGRDPAHASIALTTGIVKKLNRQELETVIAHEMGHVINRDITLMLITVAGISFFALAGNLLFRIMLHSGSSRSRSKNAGAAMLIILAAAVVCMVYANIIAPLIRLAISRSREYLADATAAHTTRNPLALASALRKISHDSRVESLDKMTSMAAMCIESPLSGSGGVFGFLSGLTATHPQVEKRIAALELMGR